MPEGPPVQDRVAGLLPAIAERAAAAAELRRASEETVGELVDPGGFRVLQPERHGGAEAGPTTSFQAVLFTEAAQQDGWGSSFSFGCDQLGCALLGALVVGAQGPVGGTQDRQDGDKAMCRTARELKTMAVPIGIPGPG
jgi:hypothetical protein